MTKIGGIDELRDVKYTKRNILTGETMFIRGVHTTAVSVGETIKELLKAKGSTPRALAQELGITEKELTEIMDGDAELTRELALKLEAIFSVSAKSWIAANAMFRKKKLQALKELGA